MGYITIVDEGINYTRKQKIQLKECPHQLCKDTTHQTNTACTRQVLQINAVLTVVVWLAIYALLHQNRSYTSKASAVQIICQLNTSYHGIAIHARLLISYTPTRARITLDVARQHQ